MAHVRVSPDEFVLMKYDPGEIAEIAGRVCDDVGLPGDDVVALTIDESTPLNRVTLSSWDPVAIEIEGGAFEDVKHPRTLSVPRTRGALVRVLLRVHDRRTPGFASAPPEPQLTLAQAEAWDACACGRAERLGYVMQRQRRLYNFRNRHGFSDVSDAAFDRLWSADTITWTHVLEVCAQTTRSPAT